MHMAQCTHICKLITLTQIQRMHKAQVTHICQLTTMTQIQSMYMAQCAHICKLITPTIIMICLLKWISKIVDFVYQFSTRRIFEELKVSFFSEIFT
jgi:flagellar biosynthesis protein FlhB